MLCFHAGAAPVAQTLNNVSLLTRRNTYIGGCGIFVAYLSAVRNREKRDILRHTCLRDVASHGLPYRFFVGRPNFPDRTHHRSQGSQATDREKQVVKQLEEEQAMYGDLRVIPFLDQYKDLSDKVAGIFDYALDAGYDMVLKIDDDMCPTPKMLPELLRRSRQREALYAGSYLWQATEFPAMRGADGNTTPYFSGVCYAVSGTLGSIIWKENAFNTALWQAYGTDSDDVNMGKWFEHAKRGHNYLNFSRLVLKDHLCVDARRRGGPGLNWTPPATAAPCGRRSGGTPPPRPATTAWSIPVDVRLLIGAASAVSVALPLCCLCGLHCRRSSNDRGAAAVPTEDPGPPLDLEATTVGRLEPVELPEANRLVDAEG